MSASPAISAAAVRDYLHSRARRLRWTECLAGRRYLIAHYSDRARPLMVIAHSFRDASMARQTALCLEQDWMETPAACREGYENVLLNAPSIIILQLRRRNLCGCLGHRHPYVREAPFAETHDAFRGASLGEMDLAYQRVEPWQALPLSDGALDAKFLEGSRLREFHKKQFRLKMLSIILHETHHLTAPDKPEKDIRERSVSFYRDALAAYVETALASLSLTIDRSFSRLS